MGKHANKMTFQISCGIRVVRMQFHIGISLWIRAKSWPDGKHTAKIPVWKGPCVRAPDHAKWLPIHFSCDMNVTDKHTMQKFRYTAKLRNDWPTKRVNRRTNEQSSERASDRSRLTWNRSGRKVWCACVSCAGRSECVESVSECAISRFDFAMVSRCVSPLLLLSFSLSLSFSFIFCAFATGQIYTSNCTVSPHGYSYIISPLSITIIFLWHFVFWKVISRICLLSPIDKRMATYTQWRAATEGTRNVRGVTAAAVWCNVIGWNDDA